MPFSLQRLNSGFFRLQHPPKALGIGIKALHILYVRRFHSGLVGSERRVVQILFQHFLQAALYASDNQQCTFAETVFIGRFHHGYGRAQPFLQNLVTNHQRFEILSVTR